MRWEKLRQGGENSDGKRFSGLMDGPFGPGTRWGHTCNAIRGGKLLYIFGGYGKDMCQTNDVHVFDTAKQVWSRPVMKGNPPLPRDSHSCTTVANNLFVFGGTDGKEPLNDLYILDTSSNTWICPSSRGDGPDAREGHSAALVGKRIFVFGGCGKSRDDSDEVYYNDLYILDTETLVWRRGLTSGTPPSARDSHTSSAWKNKIVVVAGEDASDYYLSDVHVLDTDTLVWRELDTAGQMLPPRAGHCTVALGSHLFVLGGFTNERNLYDDLHVFNLEAGIWTKVEAVGEGPSTRFSVGADCLDAQKGILVFTGGCNQDLEALDDIYYLHTEISSENGQEEPRPEKFSLRKELKRKCLEQCHPVTVGLPATNKDMHHVAIEPHLSRPMLLPSYGQAEKNLALSEFRPSQKNVFEAKVTESFQYGYTIQTNIGGQPLRGVVFSSKPSFSHAANPYLSSKSTSGVLNSNDTNNAHLQVARIPQQVDHRRTDGRKEATSESLEATTAFDSTNPTPGYVSQDRMVPENSESSRLPPDPTHGNGDNISIDTFKGALLPNQEPNN